MTRTFENNRGDVTHSYEISSEGLTYRAGTKTTLVLKWSEIKGLRRWRDGAVALKTEKHTPLALWLKSSDVEPFFEAFFGAWQAKDPGAALKASFDYGSDRKTLGWFGLLGALAFPGLLTALLLGDAFQTAHCTRLLNEAPKTAKAQVTKVKKNSRGNMIWTLEFTAEGQAVKGKRTAFVFDKDGKPLSDVMVIYSAEDLTCWDLSLSSEKPELPHTHRKFSLLLTMAFGWFFALTTVLTSIWALLKILGKNPHRETIEAIHRRSEEAIKKQKAAI